MASKLTDNINSQYFDAANHMRPKWKQMKIIAYVESYDDIAFWRSVLADYEDEKRCFEVVLPSRTDLSRGKKSAIMHNLGKNLGTSMIACVDADYDYLMQGHNEFSKMMLENPFIIHTFVYAIENYQCFAPSLHSVCTSSTLNDHQVFDFTEFFKVYSEIIYNLFMWQVWIHREGRAGEFPMTAFNNLVMMKKINVYNPEEALGSVRKNVNQKMSWMQKRFPEAKGALQQLKDELAALGVTQENTYLYIQGHNLVDNIVLPLLAPICTSLRKRREKEIQEGAKNAQQLNNELQSYQHSQIPVDEALRRNTSFRSAPQYKQMQERIENMLSLITSKP